jgi:hypothetical protein
MIKRFLRLFREYRDLEKDRERDRAVMASVNRYIEALEGRDRERQIKIEELEAAKRAALKAAADLREQLDSLRLNHKEEP